MGNLDKLFKDKTPKEDRNWRLADINVQCGACEHEADEVYVSTDKKHIKTIHHLDEDTHVVEADLDLTWLIN